MSGTGAPPASSSSSAAAGPAPDAQAEILAFLRERGVAVEVCEHPAVYTVEEAKRLVPMHSGTSCKNLFVQTKKGDRLFLVVVPYEKSVDLRALGEALGAGKLSLASPATLLEVLGVTPGAVSVFGLMRDRDHRATPVVDQALWAAARLQAHPLVNTATIAFDHAGLETFLAATGHRPVVLDVPAR